MYITKPCHHRTSNLTKLKFLLPLHFAPLCHQMKLLLTALFFLPDPFTPQLFCPSHPGSIHIPLFTFSTPFSKVHLHSPYPIIKTILPCRSGLLIPPQHEQPAFHRKVLPLSLSHECMVLIASSMQLSLQSHKWKCFVGRCTSHISLKRKSEG